MTDHNKESDNEDEIETKSISISNLSPAIVQAVYKELLDTTETLAKSFKPGRIVDRDDIRSFCERFHQTCTQYQTKGAKTTFTIRRDEDHTEKFTTLDRFLASDAQGGRQTAGITIEFSFLLMPPGYEKYQEYKSALHIDSSDFTEKDGSEAFLINAMGLPTFSFSIEYSDYSVARSFVSMTEDWYKSLRKVKTSPILDWIRSKFNFFTDANLYTNTIVFVTTIFSVYSCYRIYSAGGAGSGNDDLVKFMLICFSLIYTSRFAAITISNLLIRLIGNYRIPNFVVFNRIDKDNLEKFDEKRKGFVRKGLYLLIASGLTISFNLLSSYIYNAIR